jgi:hypothetical protein
MVWGMVDKRCNNKCRQVTKKSQAMPGLLPVKMLSGRPEGLKSVMKIGMPKSPGSSSGRLQELQE